MAETPADGRHLPESSSRRRAPSRLVLLYLGLSAALPAPAQTDPTDPVVTAIDAGSYHTCALTTVGGVKCWGDGSALGVGPSHTSLTPVNVSGLTSGVAAISVGYHTCAVTTAGGVKCWGSNWSGQLGDGSREPRTAPVDVLGLPSVAVVAAGDAHTCAVTTTGGVKCWGANSDHQLGDGTTTERFTPVDVMGLHTGVTKVRVSGALSCALTTGGGVKCWGWGQPNPAFVPGLMAGVTDMSLGSNFACALMSSGGLKCWGDNNWGQLGDGTTTYRPEPVDVAGLTSGVSAISTGFGHTCAVTVSGGLKCWGANISHQLGDGTEESRATPGDVWGLTTGVANVTAGFLHTCATMRGGGAKCWGRAAGGALGDGTDTFDQNTPVNVSGLMALSGLTSGVHGIATGIVHTCIVNAMGAVQCWGKNEDGQLGDGTRTSRTTPLGSVDLASGVSSISVGARHTCAVTTLGGAQCWGYDGEGQLGNGGLTATQLTPGGVLGLTSGVSTVSSGLSHACALTSAGGLKCWGDNSQGQLGDGSTTTRISAVDVSGMTSGVASIAAGHEHTCAVTFGGGVKCWGDNQFGQLGDGTTSDRLAPVDVVGLTSGIQQVFPGVNHTCALTLGGGVKCWGRNTHWQLGDGVYGNMRLVPGDVSGLTSGVVSVAAGGYHTCALTSAGGMKCWGSDAWGQLGNGDEYPAYEQKTPVDVVTLTTGVATIAAAEEHSCALTTGGVLKCWGQNSAGQLGIGTKTNREIPITVRSDPRAGQAIAFNAPATVAAGMATLLVASSTSGLPVIFDTWTPSTCIVTGNSLTATGGALCGIRASQAGDGVVAPAPQQLRLVTVEPGPPVLTAPSISSVTAATATMMATSFDGGSPITERGFVYSSTAANADPLIGGFGVTKLSTTGTTGTFALGVMGLMPATPYSFKAYATNAIGTGYTETTTFATLQPASRVFASASGSDTNDCASVGTPCRSLAGGLAQVADDGEVVVVSTGEYDATPILISKGVKITAPSGTVALIRQPVTVDAPGARVVLRGLFLRGSGSGIAVTMTAADTLSIEDATLEGWSAGLRLGNAIPAHTSVTRSVFRTNGSAIDDLGASGNSVSIEASRFEGNGSGIDTTGAALVVRETAFVGNSGAGVRVGPGSAHVQRCEFALNGTAIQGLAGGTVTVGRSWVFANGTGLSAAPGSTFASSGTNVIRLNGTDTIGTIAIVPEQ